MIDRISEIKSRIRIEEFITKYVHLDNYNKALCPFHKEKTSSFSVNKKKQIFKCFGCQESGDVIEFYEKYFKVDKAAAIKELYESIGGNVQRPVQEIPAQGQNDKAFNDDFLECLSDIEKDFYYERAGIAGDDMALKEVKRFRLARNSEVFEEFCNYCTAKSIKYSKKAFDYLINKRKLQQEWLERFRIFVIGNYNEVSNHLKKKFSLDQLKRSGLYNDRGNLIFFKHRIIIPYLHKGRIIYLRARYFDEEGFFNDNCSKYIGLSDDALHLNTARRFFNTDILNYILPWEKLYITEGEFDCIVLSGLGKNTICIPGVGNIPSNEKFKRLSSNEIIYCGDNDTAGDTLLNGWFINKKTGKLQRREVYLQKIFADMKKELFVMDLNGAKDVNDFLVQLQ